MRTDTTQRKLRAIGTAVTLAVASACSSSGSRPPAPVKEVAQSYAAALASDDEVAIRRLSCANKTFVDGEVGIARGGTRTGPYKFSYRIGAIRTDRKTATVEIIQGVKSPSSTRRSDMAVPYTFELTGRGWLACSRH